MPMLCCIKINKLKYVYINVFKFKNLHMVLVLELKTLKLETFLAVVTIYTMNFF